MIEPLLFAVGSPNPIRMPEPVADGMFCHYLDQMPVLSCYLEQVTRRDDRLFRHERARIGLIGLPPHGYSWLLDLKFLTMEATVAPALEPPATRHRPPAEPGMHLPITLLLCDHGQIIRSMRQFTIPPDVVAVLEGLHAGALRHEASFSRPAWHAAVRQHEARYPTPLHAFPKADAVTTGGLNPPKK